MRASCLNIPSFHHPCRATTIPPKNSENRTQYKISSFVFIAEVHPVLQELKTLIGRVDYLLHLFLVFPFEGWLFRRNWWGGWRLLSANWFARESMQTQHQRRSLNQRKGFYRFSSKSQHWFMRVISKICVICAYRIFSTLGSPRIRVQKILRFNYVELKVLRAI